MCSRSGGFFTMGTQLQWPGWQPMEILSTTLPFAFWWCIIHEVELRELERCKVKLESKNLTLIFWSSLNALLTTENRHFIAEYLFILKNNVQTVSNIIFQIFYSWGIYLEKKSHFSTCLKQLKMSFATIFDTFSCVKQVKKWSFSFIT